MKLPAHKLRDVDYYRHGVEEDYYERTDVITVYWKPQQRRFWRIRYTHTPAPTSFRFPRSQEPGSEPGWMVFVESKSCNMLRVQLQDWVDGTFEQGREEEIEARIQDLLKEDA